MTRVPKSALTKQKSGATKKPGEHKTDEERYELERLIEMRMLSHPTSTGTSIARWLRKSHEKGVTDVYVRDVISKILTRWRTEDERSQRKDQRSRQTRMVLLDMENARKRGKFSDVAKFHEIYMRLTGTAVPEEVRVDITVTNALKEVILDMQESEMIEILGDDKVLQ